MINRGQDFHGFCNAFDVVICDEFHYFFSDSDFNGAGTYCLLKALIKSFLIKTMLFLSATPDQTKPFVKKMISDEYHAQHRDMRLPPHIDPSDNHAVRLYFQHECGGRENWNESYDDCNTIYEVLMPARSYDPFKCFCLPTIDDLARHAASSSGKTVIFIDSKEAAASLKIYAGHRMRRKCIRGYYVKC